MQHLLPIGVIVQPHGIRGEVRVHLFNPESDALFEAENLWLKRTPNSPPTAFKIIDVREHTKGLLVTLEGCNDRNAAEALCKAEILIDKESLPAPEDGEFYFYQLEGLPVFATTGEELGHVLRVVPGAAQDLLVLSYQQREVLIPITDALVPVIDTENGRIEIELIPGLLDEIT